MGNDNRDYTMMFDGDKSTYWHGATEPVEVRNSVTVKFHKQVQVRQLAYDARPSNLRNPQRYQNVCMYLNEQKSACTPSDMAVTLGQEIILPRTILEPITTVYLEFPDGECGKVAELRIFYEELGYQSNYQQIFTFIYRYYY